jgi:hypothetical protein
VVGVRVGNAARFAIVARIERERGIEQTDGFVVDEQGFLNFLPHIKTSTFYRDGVFFSTKRQ